MMNPRLKKLLEHLASRSLVEDQSCTDDRLKKAIDEYWNMLGTGQEQWHPSPALAKALEIGIQGDLSESCLAIASYMVNAIPLTWWQLQGVLFFAQGYSLAYTMKELFPDDFRKTPRGFVIPRMSRRFQELIPDWISSPVKMPPTDIVGPMVTGLLDAVLKRYGWMYPGKMSSEIMSLDIWRNLGENEIVSKDQMAVFFRGRMA